MITAIDRFIGREHCAHDYDCADLAMEVSREVFGREIVLPTKRPRPLGQQGQAAAIRVAIAELAYKITQPEDGDLVLMYSAGQTMPGHIGTYFFLNHQAHVLHTSVALGHASLHTLTALPTLSLRVAGFYRWKYDNASG